MFLNNSKDNEDKNSWLSILLAFILSLVLLSLGSIGWLADLKVGITYMLDPVYTTTSTAARNIKDFFATLINISDFQEEYNEMKLRISQYEIDNLGYQEILDENKDLKEQLNLGNQDYTYLQSEVLDHIETDYITVNTGLRDGVSKGDVAVLGNSFVGIVIDTGQYISKVRLPISKSNFLEVYVRSSEESNQRVLSRAVVSGSSDGIKIENIDMNSGVQNGDIVVVNDSEVGENLILGTIVGLSKDPAATTREGYVSPVIDYYDLVNIFIRIDHAD